MQPLVSVVMPVYNAAEYLKKAVFSVLTQTEEDWELILVDDASTDGSSALCDCLAQEDIRISVIHKRENGGLSRARNTGMEAARGRYLMFMDSDDWIDPTLLERAAQPVRSETPPQLVVWGVCEEHYDAAGKPITDRRVCVPNERAQGNGQVRRCALRLEQATLLGYAWNKLYDMQLLKKSGAAFESVPLIEDILFNLAVLPHISDIMVLDGAPYHYARRTSGSLTHRSLPYYWEMNSRRIAEMLRLYEGWGMKEEAARALAPIFARYALSALERNCHPDSGMNAEGRRLFAEKLLKSDLYAALRPHMNSGGGLGGMVGRLLAMKNTGICLAAGKGVYLVRTRMSRLFVHVSGQGGSGK